MTSIMDPANNVFFNEYGVLDADKRLFSKLLRRYPRKIGSIFEIAFDLRLLATRMPSRIRQAAAFYPPTRRVLIIGVEVPSRPELMAHVRATLPVSRHNVAFFVRTMEKGRLKFDNLNDLLREHFTSDIDWLIITDDDIAIPANFLDCFIYLLERFKFKIGQPAHRLRSHATFIITRRHWGTVARRTNYVEIGPLVALHRETFADLIPFPPVGMGWGLDYHWALLAKKKGWRVGIIDALPIQHLRPVASGYGPHGFHSALCEGRRFLKAHGGLSQETAHKTVTALRSI
jgi:hypothetical protein